jgi:uncharacterized protein YigE (DUF2233 family)
MVQFGPGVMIRRAGGSSSYLNRRLESSRWVLYVGPESLSLWIYMLNSEYPTGSNSAAGLRLGLAVGRPLLCFVFLLPLFFFARTARCADWHWEEVEDGYATAVYDLTSPDAVVRSPVTLAKFNPKKFIFAVTVAADFGEKQADTRFLAESINGAAAVNANFFDPQGEALGLVVSNGEQRQRIHLGGDLLNGIFAVSNFAPRILPRENFHLERISSAAQAGPLLVLDGKPQQISASSVASRRSGVAITRSGEVIVFATQLRFPGASLAEIQRMLTDPVLDVDDALNFDGGGSSQLYLKQSSKSTGERFISGGDLVPVALVVKRRS